MSERTNPLFRWILSAVLIVGYAVFFHAVIV